MSCNWICWGALVLLIGAVMVGLGIMLFPRGEQGRNMRSDLNSEVDQWSHPEKHREKHAAPPPAGPNT